MPNICCGFKFFCFIVYTVFGVFDCWFEKNGQFEDVILGFEKLMSCFSQFSDILTKKLIENNQQNNC